MHNCNALRETLMEMALNRVPNQNPALTAELEQCFACREEFASLRNALRVTDQAMQNSLPAEEFWSGYNSRLRQRLETDSEAGVASRYSAPPSRAGILVRLGNLVTASVRVPVPLASAVVVLFFLSILFAIYSRRTLSAAPATNSPAVITETIEVPVMREKLVTRVVYLERDRRTNRLTAPRRQAERTSVARRQNDATANAPVSLVGFKPADDVKLTIIKGSYRDDK